MLQTRMLSGRAASMRFSSSTIGSNLRPSKLPTGAPARAFTQQCTPKPRAKAPPGTGFTFSSNARPTPLSTILQRLRNLNTRFLHSTRASRNGKTGGAATATEEPTTLGGKMRKLSREYGWSAVGVYFFLSAVDFPFCFALVRTLGVDRIGRWEHVVVSNVATVIPESVKTHWASAMAKICEWREAMKKAEIEMTNDDNISEGVEMAGWGVQEAEKKNKAEASIGTQLALAYAIHKSFIFIRVPLTVAVTPKIVKILRQWGWDIGKRTSKETKALNRTIRQRPKSRAPRKWRSMKFGQWKGIVRKWRSPKP